MARGKEWTTEELERVIEMKREGYTLQEIADSIGRTEAAITLQISKLRVKKRLMDQQNVTRDIGEFEDVPIEEYSEEEMRAATKDGGDNAECSCVTMPVIPCGDKKTHPLGKLPHDRSLSVRALERPLRDAKTVLHTVHDLIAMLHADEDRKVDGILAFGTLLADAQRLVEDLEEIVKG